MSLSSPPRSSSSNKRIALALVIAALMSAILVKVFSDLALATPASERLPQSSEITSVS